jgi:hypothetical protein
VFPRYRLTPGSLWSAEIRRSLSGEVTVLYDAAMSEKKRSPKTPIAEPRPRSQQTFTIAAEATDELLSRASRFSMGNKSEQLSRDLLALYALLKGATAGLPKLSGKDAAAIAAAVAGLDRMRAAQLLPLLAPEVETVKGLSLLERLALLETLG